MNGLNIFHTTLKIIGCLTKCTSFSRIGIASWMKVNSLFENAGVRPRVCKQNEVFIKSDYILQIQKNMLKKIKPFGKTWFYHYQHILFDPIICKFLVTCTFNKMALIKKIIWLRPNRRCSPFSNFCSQLKSDKDVSNPYHCTQIISIFKGPLYTTFTSPRSTLYNSFVFNYVYAKLWYHMCHRYSKCQIYENIDPYFVGE